MSPPDTKTDNSKLVTTGTLYVSPDSGPACVLKIKGSASIIKHTAAKAENFQTKADESIDT